MSKHTPGPWNIVPRAAPKGSLMIACVAGGLEPLIAVMEHTKSGPITYEDAEKNALLVASAPALLSELRFAVALLKPMFGCTVQVQRMEQAIAKATGEHP